MGMLTKFFEFITEGINDIIAKFAESIMNNMFFFNNIFEQPGIMQRYEMSKYIGNWILIIATIMALCAMMMNIDVFSAARFKKILRDIVLSAFFMNVGIEFIKLAFKVANILTEIWMPNIQKVGDIGTAILATVGLSVAHPLTYKTLGFGLFCLVIILVLFLVLLLISHGIVNSLMGILIVIGPLMIAAFPIDRAKNYTWKWITLLFGLLLLSPLQMLSISLTAEAVLGNNISFGGVANSIGMLVVTVLIIPGVVFYLISLASNPRMLE